MKSRFAPAAAALSVLGLVAWLALSEPPESGRSAPPASAPPPPDDAPVQAAGSAVPCAVPLAWRLADVDARFGVSRTQVSEAIGQAVALWERALGRRLFLADSTAAFPIRIVYDDRQARTQERLRGEERIRSVRRELAEAGAELSARRADHLRVRTAYEERLTTFQGRMTIHNAAVRTWNERGGAPDTVLPELRSAEQGLERERRELDVQETELERLERSLQDDSERIRRARDEQDRREEALVRMFPVMRVESGRYQEVVARQGGRVLSVRREIDIYQFDDLGHLRHVVAHELGHALGLGHAPLAGSVMSEEHGRADRAAAEIIPPVDAAMLRSLCPDL